MEFPHKLFNKLFFAFSFSAFALLGGCKDDFYIPDTDIDGSMDESDKFGLVFNVSLDIDPATRAWDVGFLGAHSDAEAYENFVDTQDKFRVFFFTEDGEFLFGAIDRTISLGGEGTDNTQTYTVRVPMNNTLIDRDGNEYDIAQIKNYLRTHDFKVAVLANWPNAGGKVNPGDYDDSDTTLDQGENPSSSLKGHPLWGVKNSYFYNESGKDLKTINDLHFLFDEANMYAFDRAIGSNTHKNFDIYYPFFKSVTDTDGSQIYAAGEPTDWVKMRDVSRGWTAMRGWDDAEGHHPGYSRKSYALDFDSKETANIWIRANWNPNVALNNEKGIYRHYQNLWYLWNFDASFKYALYKNNEATYPNYANAYISNFGWSNGYVGAVNTWGEEWYKRNGQRFYEWMRVSSSTAPLQDLYIVTGTGQNDSFFSFKAFSNNPGCYRVTNPASYNHDGVDYYGLRLPSRGTSSQVGNTSEGVISFQARTSGTLRIKWGNGNDNERATIRVQKGNTILKEYSISSGNRYKLYDLGGTSSDDTFYDIAMGDDSAPIYIYCTQGAAVIYAIEYIRGKYLFETDREGVVPNEAQAIPMYGVQDFTKLSNWVDGNTETIQPSDNTMFRLLRSLAKVEVYVPTSFGRPRHMYMRGMNRSARCEPMDVFNPTHWTDQPTGNLNHPQDCEFFKLMDYQACYDPASPSKTNLSTYQQWMSWFYGSWKDFGYNFNGKVTPPTVAEKGEYPKIFNPYVNRSDFCHMIYVGEVENYHKYVLYMPEKFIDDPSDPGVRESKPVVPHIEYRFTPGVVNDDDDDKLESLTRSEFNLDDNNCYRIYFTNYGKNPDRGGLGPINNDIQGVSGDSFVNYEVNRTHLNYHWPILRNHKYQFYVSGSGPESAIINVRITDWTHEKVVVEW